MTKIYTHSFSLTDHSLVSSVPLHLSTVSNRELMSLLLAKKKLMYICLRDLELMPESLMGMWLNISELEGTSPERELHMKGFHLAHRHRFRVSQVTRDVLVFSSLLSGLMETPWTVAWKADWFSKSHITKVCQPLLFFTKRIKWLLLSDEIHHWDRTQPVLLFVIVLFQVCRACISLQYSTQPLLGQLFLVPHLSVLFLQCHPQTWRMWIQSHHWEFTRTLSSIWPRRNIWKSLNLISTSGTLNHSPFELGNLDKFLPK